MSDFPLLDFPLDDVEEGPPAQAFGNDVRVATGPHRRRIPPPPPPPSPVFSPPPPPTFAVQPIPEQAGKSRIQQWIDGIKQRIDNVRKSIQLRRINFWLRLEPTMTVWWKRRFIIQRLACVLCIGILGAAWFMSYFSRQDSYVAEIARPTWARFGQEGIDFSAKSTEISCSELETGRLVGTVLPSEEPSLVRLRSYASHLLHDGSLTCLCAPMFGTRRRYMAVQLPSGKIQHMYNPVIDNGWNGKLPDGSAAMPGKAYVKLQQRMLFPGKSDAVECVRLNSMRITYRDEACASSAVILQKQAAWCAQTCIHLMNGQTVYDEAA